MVVNGFFQNIFWIYQIFIVLKGLMILVADQIEPSFHSYH